MLFLSLAISDLMSSAFQVPLLTINQINVEWPLGTVMCYVHILYFGVKFGCDNYFLMMLAIHRFLQITKPYRHHERITKKKIAILILSFLLLSLVMR